MILRRDRCIFRLTTTVSCVKPRWVESLVLLSCKACMIESRCRSDREGERWVAWSRSSYEDRLSYCQGIQSVVLNVTYASSLLPALRRSNQQGPARDALHT